MKILILFMTTSAFAGIDLCRRDPLCDDLRTETARCSKSMKEADCTKFTTTFEKLLGPRKCNAEGRQIRFSIQSCGKDVFSTSSKLLDSLKF